MERCLDEIQMVQELDAIHPLGCIVSSNPVYTGLWRRCHRYSHLSTPSHGNTSRPTPCTHGHGGTRNTDRSSPRYGNTNVPAPGAHSHPSAYGACKGNSPPYAYRYS